MNCEFVRENLADIVEKTLSPATQKEIDAHLSSCEGCARLVEQFAQLWQVWEDPARVEPSALFWAKLQQRIRGSEEKRTATATLLPRWERWLRPIAATVTVLIGILIGHHLGDFPVAKGIDVPAQEGSVETEQLFDYYLGGLVDFPAGSVAESYVNLGQNS